MRADDVLGTVGGSSVHDHPVVDERPHAVDAPTDYGRLVLDDHVQTDQLTGSVHQRLHPTGRPVTAMDTASHPAGFAALAVSGGATGTSGHSFAVARASADSTRSRAASSSA